MTIVPTYKGATPTLLARRLGMGRSGSGPAEWPVENASGPRQKPGAAGSVLRRVDGLLGLVVEDEPEFGVGLNLDKRETFSPLDRDRAARSLAVVLDEPVCPAPRSNLSRGESVNHHRISLRLV